MESKSILCAHHRRTVTFYCLKHDFPCCVRCISTHHSKCADILSEDDLYNVKESAAAEENNEAVCNLQQNFEPFKSRISETLNILDEQKIYLFKEIKVIKTRLERRLNQSFEKLEDEISEHCRKVKTEINTDQRKIKQVDIVLKRIDTQKKTNETVSNMQYFLGMKENIRLVKKAHRNLEVLASHDWLKDVSLNFSANHEMLDKLDIISKESIGKVSLTKIRGPIFLKHYNRNKAQVILKENEIEDNKYTAPKVRIKENIETENFNVVPTSTENLDSSPEWSEIVLDKDNNRLDIYEGDKFSRSIQLSVKPKSIYEIKDSKVKVTYGKPLKYTTVDISKTKEPVPDYELYGINIFVGICLFCMLVASIQHLCKYFANFMDRQRR